MSLSIHRSCSDNGPTTVTEHKVNRLCCSDTGCQEKQVRFAPVAIRQSYDNYENDPSDAESTWYDLQDYKKFLYDRHVDAYRMKEKHPNDLSDSECFWGMEHIIVKDMKKKIIKTRSNLRNAVLEEQESQLTKCRRNVGAISRVSRAHTEWSETVARKKGLFYQSNL